VRVVQLLRTTGGPARGTAVPSFALKDVLANPWPRAGALTSVRRRRSECVLAFCAASMLAAKAALNVRACPRRIDTTAASTRHLRPLACRAAGRAAQVQRPSKRFAVSGSCRALLKRCTIGMKTLFRSCHNPVGHVNNSQGGQGNSTGTPKRAQLAARRQPHKES
jgi:hypothetical protein